MNWYTASIASTINYWAIINPNKIKTLRDLHITIEKCTIEEKEHLPEDLWNIEDW